MENMKSEKRTFIPVSVELRDRLKELKGKGVSYERFIEDLINSESKRLERGIFSDNTHTHKTHEKKSGVEDVMEFIKKYYPDAITRAGIEDAIRQTKGMDQRTISKYKPVVLQSLLSGGYSRHPENPLLFLKV